MNYGLHILKNNDNTYSFFGTVPTELAYVKADGSPFESEELYRELKLPEEQRSIKFRVWSTYEDALNEAIKLNYEISK